MIRSTQAPYSFTVAEKAVVEIANLKIHQKAKSLRNLAREAMQAWLADTGPVDHVVETKLLAKEPGGTKPLLAAGHHIFVFWKHLRWSMSVQESVRFVDPAFLASHKSTAQLCHEQPEDGKAAASLQKQTKVLRHIFSTSKLLLVPIKEAGHWTLLALEQKEAGLEMRYYDTLKEQALDCCLEAHRTAGLLVGEDVVVPDRRNSQQHTKWSCGFTSMWCV